MGCFEIDTNGTRDMTRQVLLREYSSLRESLKKISVFYEAIVDGRVQIASEDEPPSSCISNKHSAISYCLLINSVSKKVLNGSSITYLVIDLHLYGRKE